MKKLCEKCAQKPGDVQLGKTVVCGGCYMDHGPVPNPKPEPLYTTGAREAPQIVRNPRMPCNSSLWRHKRPKYGPKYRKT